MRLFFAIDINPTSQQQIADWRDNTFGGLFKVIPATNFHLTLAFLGATQDTQLTRLMAIAAHLSEQYKTHNPLITATFDCYARFNKPKVLYIGMRQHCSAVSELALQLSYHVSNLQINQVEQAYTPHISLYRKANYLPANKPPPEIHIPVQSFSLYQSISALDNASGHVQYRALKRWSLC